MRSELRQKHVDPSRLVHVVIPGDNIAGEMQGWDGEFMKVKNPKRLVKQQGMVPGKGMVVSISMIEWDMIDEGVINVRPFAWWLIRDQNEETQYRYFGIYLGHLDDQVKARARAAGLEISATPEQAKELARAASIFEGSDVRRAS